jgi:D-cysteine desulfhydrase
MTIPLLQRYPVLGERLARISIGAFPTPVHSLERFGRELGVGGLFLKDDGVSHSRYGGNKVRKLEFLLAEAQATGARELMTFGYAGSNHAAATIFHAHELGIKTVSMLLPQANAAYVRSNLLVALRCGAELHLCPNRTALLVATMGQLLRHRLTTGRRPLLIAPGGSSPCGTCGFVNAALELAGQVDAGALPLPDKIYVAAGSMGTAVGLILGLRLAGIASRVVAVRVTDRYLVNLPKMARMFDDTVNFLHRLDPSFPVVRFRVDDLELRESFFGPGYAVFTEEGMRAAARMKDATGFKLDGTYTGKTLAALCADADCGELSDKTVLFWNTYNACDPSPLVADLDYHRLPRRFHHYFEQPLQPLDAEAVSNR